MHATPESFWPSQCLPVAIRLHRVPLSSLLTHDFHFIRVLTRLSASLPPVDRLSPSRVPGFDRSHLLAFDSLTPCKVDDILRFGCYPCLIQAESEPPGRRPPAPGSSIHRGPPLPGLLYGRSGSAVLSSAFAGSHSVVLILADTHPLMEAITTLLSIVSAGVARPRARYARNPFPSGRESTPWPPPSCARFLLCHSPSPMRPFA